MAAGAYCYQMKACDTCGHIYESERTLYYHDGKIEKQIIDCPSCLEQNKK